MTKGGRNDDRGLSEELAFVSKRRLYTQRLANQIVSQVLGSSIRRVAARTGMSEEQIETMVQDAGEAYSGY